MDHNRKESVKIVNYEKLIEKVRNCRMCAGELPLAPRPIIRGNPSAKTRIIGQAPGKRVHVSGVPWNLCLNGRANSKPVAPSGINTFGW